MTIFRDLRSLYLCCGLLFLLSKPIFAADPEDRIPDPAPPPLSEEPDTLGPEIRIIQEGKVRIEEYRLNGKLYKIKVTPEVGPDYYLVDINGSGSFDRRFDGPGIVDTDALFPSWVLFRF
ncbi:hypothetical conserved protein [Candidatus Nitrosoglobus terrae]|uniref:Hypothetical conserved protein n=1 Tax=Candidatus Nitrosoglobus terrae TaxID=1630141 RepID=A0A1Q2SKK0_9GAMM|nr:DUF2782 domain-containing protein [Candidatus Nitrosoglobus terrae]BAW79633.1 hypothetical conserved protein [Candidatus Nitrosoglobus terrae]